MSTAPRTDRRPRRRVGHLRPVGRTATPRGPGAPTVERLIRVVARAAVEVLAGRRPLRQLLRLVSPAVYDRLQARLPDPGERRPAPTAAVVREVLGSWPTPAACEATVLLEHDDRTTALALRAERHADSWRIVEIAAPEEGLEPTRTRPKLDHP